MSPPLAFEQLTVTYRQGTTAVDHVDLALDAGEWVTLVGESGSGKSTLATAALGLLPSDAQVAGRAIVGDTDMANAAEATRRARRGRTVALVPQDTGSAFDPVASVVDQIAEVLAHHHGLGRRSAQAAAVARLEALGVPIGRLGHRTLPDELSGGMRQRALVAVALELAPEVVVADEPTSALDAETTLVILTALDELRSRHGTAVLFITHDLGAARWAADRVAVMHDGRIVEVGTPAAITGAPKERYTQTLVAASPVLREHGPR